MEYSTHLPKQYRTWSEFYDHVDSTLAQAKQENEFYWKEFNPVRVDVIRKIAPIEKPKPTLRYSMRYVEQQVLREVREQIKLQAFTDEELFLILKSLEYSDNLFVRSPVMEKLKAKVSDSYVLASQ